jgi:effector-binding domain-containing protein
MFKIGDFSTLSRVTVKALRYYDEIGLLKPAQIDGASGYRYYSADQLPRLYYIQALKMMGLSLEEIAILTGSEATNARIKEILVLKQKELMGRVAGDQQKLAQVENFLKQIEKEGAMPDYQVTIKQVKPLLVASVRDTVPAYGDIGRLYGEIFKHLGKKFIFKPAGPVMMLCHDHEYRESDVDIEAAVPISKKIGSSERVKVYELPEMEQAACTVHRGGYETISQAYKALMAWIEANGYQITGPDRELYFSDPTKVKKPEEIITEVQFPVKKN